MKGLDGMDISEVAQKLARDSVITKALGRYLEMVLTAVYQDEIEPLRKALESIAANTCCDRCQEAALVAKTALSFSRQAGSAND